jgi:hypothetical protein
LVNHTKRILEQGKALVRAIEALETIDHTGPIERAIVWFLLEAYRHRLPAIVASAPAWVVEQILSASEHIDDDRPVLWMSDN